MVFFSDEIRVLLAEATHIQFDGTFYTVPVQFYQLWTIFIAVGRHSIPAVHCLMTGKTEDLYRTVFEILVIHIPEFKPIASMSDWDLWIYGRLFHYT